MYPIGRVGSIRQQRECSYVDCFDTLVEETLPNTFIVASTGEQNVAANNFFSGVGLSVETVIYCIAIAVHLIYGISRRRVRAVSFIKFLSVFLIETAVIEQTILRIKKISQFKTIGLDNSKHDVRTVFSSCRMDFAGPATVSMLIIKSCFGATGKTLVASFFFRTSIRIKLCL